MEAKLEKVPVQQRSDKKAKKAERKARALAKQGQDPKSTKLEQRDLQVEQKDVRVKPIRPNKGKKSETKKELPINFDDIYVFTPVMNDAIGLEDISDSEEEKEVVKQKEKVEKLVVKNVEKVERTGGSERSKRTGPTGWKEGGEREKKEVVLDDKALHEDLEERLARFGRTNPLGEYITNKFDSLEEVLRFQSGLQTSGLEGKKIYMSRKKYPCYCKKIEDCLCEDVVDDYVQLEKCTGDISSDCLYLMNFRLNRSIEVDSDKMLLRFFVLNEELREESEVSDETGDETDVFSLLLPKKKLIIHLDGGDTLSFRIKRLPSGSYNTLPIAFNYMNYEHASQ